MKTYENDLITVKKIIPNIEELTGRMILVTGSTGLIGSALVDLLCSISTPTKIYVAARNEKKVLNRFRSSLVEYVNYDALSDIDFELELDYIIHAASPASPRLYNDEPVETMLANLIGTRNISEYAISHNVKRIVYISSSEVYGIKENIDAYKEDDFGYVNINDPRACYPSAKRAAETLLASYKKEYALDYVVVRPGHVYGPTANLNDNRVSSAFFYDVLAGKDILLKSAGLQRRSYCYVADCATAILTALINGESGKAYNISNVDSVCSIRDLAESIAEVSGRELVFENPNQSEKQAFNPMQNSILDSEELSNLGWKACFDLKTGVSHTYNSLKERLSNV